MLHELKKVSSIPESFHLVPAAAGGAGGGYPSDNRTGIKSLTTRKNKKDTRKYKKVTPKNRQKTKKALVVTAG